MKAPPRRSATPSTPKTKPADMRKEASRRSASNRKPLPGFTEQDSGQTSTHTAFSRAHTEEAEPKDHWASLGRYDPWPYSNDKQGSGKTAEASSTKGQAGSSKPSTSFKEGAKQPSTPATPNRVSSSSIEGTKKLRLTQPTSKVTKQRQAAVTSPPEHFAYRPATPKTPPRASPSPAARLPEMRKFPTPQKSRTATPNKYVSTPQSGRTSTPQVNRTLTSHFDQTPTKGSSNTTPGASRGPSTLSSHRVTSDYRDATTQVDRNVFSSTPVKNTQKDDVQMETS